MIHNDRSEYTYVGGYVRYPVIVQRGDDVRTELRLGKVIGLASGAILVDPNDGGLHRWLNEQQWRGYDARGILGVG